MLQVFPDEGLTLMLRRIAHNNGDGLIWRLFTNDVEPDPDNELEDFDLAGTWGTRVVEESDFVLEQVVAHVGTIQANTINLENDTGGDVTVYGFVAYEPVTETLLMVYRYPEAPITVPDGETIPMTPVLGDYSDLTVPIIDGGTF